MSSNTIIKQLRHYHYKESLEKMVDCYEAGRLFHAVNTLLLHNSFKVSKARRLNLTRSFDICGEVVQFV